MAMRRGHHTSRVLKALGTRPDALNNETIDPDTLADDTKLPSEFDEA
jgi:acetolactate synthase-1/3 small subunit